MNWPFIINSSVLYLFCIFLISINAAVPNIIWLIFSYCIFILLLRTFTYILLNMLNELYTVKPVESSQPYIQNPKFLPWILSFEYMPWLALRCSFPLISFLLCPITPSDLNVAYRTCQKCLPTGLSLGYLFLYCPGSQLSCNAPAYVTSHRWVSIYHKDSTVSHYSFLRLCFSKRHFVCFPITTTFC